MGNVGLALTAGLALSDPNFSTFLSCACSVSPTERLTHATENLRREAGSPPRGMAGRFVPRGKVTCLRSDPERVGVNWVSLWVCVRMSFMTRTRLFRVDENGQKP